MGIGTWLRKRVAIPVAEKIDLQSQVIFESHMLELMHSPPFNEPKRLERFGFRSFSQNDEDGILQEIFNRIGVEHSTFVEFGVGDGTQCNTMLLLYKEWRGLWIEGNPSAYQSILRTYQRQMSSRQLQVLGRFVTVGTINTLIDSAGLGELDLLSIDIDGNDYWIWEAITLQPRVLVIEYNAKFRPPVKWVMEYDPQYRWDGSDHQGASLQSLALLGQKKGYTLVGCCVAGINAFFVRDDLVKDLFPAPDVAALYNPPRWYVDSFMRAGHAAVKVGPYRSI